MKNIFPEWFFTPIITIQVSGIIEFIGVFLIIYLYMKTRKYISLKNDFINVMILSLGIGLIMITQL